MPRAAVCLLLALLFAAPVAGEPTVVLLSLDGVRYDYPERGALPAFQRMQREGARAERLVPVFPSSTFPNHVSLATGTHADRHGIVGNRFLDPDRGFFDYSNDAGFLQAEPLWVAAERQGVPAAVFFWVGSETDWQGQGARYRKAPFDGGVPEAEKVDQILAWLDLPEGERPRLILSWWHGADGVGHDEGPDSPGILDQLKRQDAQLGRLLAGLDSRDAWVDTTLIVVSDHGMARVDEAVDPGAVLAAAGIGARVVSGSAYAHVHLSKPDQAPAAVAALTAVEGVSAYPADAVPEALRYRVSGRTGQVVALAEPPRIFRRGLEKTWMQLRSVVGAPVGAHGYDPAAHPEMGAVFLALGRGVRAGTALPAVRTVDVAATVTSLLGIEPPRDSEGAPIAGVGSD